MSTKYSHDNLSSQSENKPHLRISPAAVKTPSLVIENINISAHRRVNELDANRLNEPHGAIYGFAQLHESGQIIWTNALSEQFKLASNLGRNVRPIQSSFEAPYALLLKSFFGHTTLVVEDDAIRWWSVDEQLNESERGVVLNLQGREVHGLGYDQDTQRLYVGDAQGQVAFYIEWPSAQSTSGKPHFLRIPPNRKRTS